MGDPDGRFMAGFSGRSISPHSLHGMSCTGAHHAPWCPMGTLQQPGGCGPRKRLMHEDPRHTVITSNWRDSAAGDGHGSGSPHRSKRPTGSQGREKPARVTSARARSLGSTGAREWQPEGRDFHDKIRRTSYERDAVSRHEPAEKGYSRERSSSRGRWAVAEVPLAMGRRGHRSTVDEGRRQQSDGFWTRSASSAHAIQRLRELTRGILSTAAAASQIAGDEIGRPGAEGTTGAASNYRDGGSQAELIPGRAAEFSRRGNSLPGKAAEEVASTSFLAGERQGRERSVPSEGGGRLEFASVGALWTAKKSQVPQLVQELEEKLSRGTVECMICYDMISRGSPVWSCASCYAIFHLCCIKKWASASNSVDLTFASSSFSLDGNWRCPGCQAVESIGAKDLWYYCFCGRVENPSMDHHVTPHSCGGPCKKTLDRSQTKRCNHHCTLQCHPGPCPPCTARAPSESCPCGKKVLPRRCGEQKAIASCGQVCGRLLLCGRHACSRTCHDGPCDSCTVEVKTHCFCGAKQETWSCGRVELQGELEFDKGLFSCASPCSKMLSCENHRCQEKCHPGQCGDCELAPTKLQTCPCGKKKLWELGGTARGRKSCVDAIPTCLQACGKLLSCGLHACLSLCHTGPCPPCKAAVDQKCRCRSTTRSLPCSVSRGEGTMGDGKVELFLCEKKCGQKKRCGRHRCAHKCCPALADGTHRQQDDGGRGPHECTLNCGKKLSCKQHCCQEQCHSGPCPPCLDSIFTELSCACGKTAIPPPSACGTPFPSCQQPCSFTRACGHPPTHLCHFGDCPPCAVPVSKECVGSHVILRGVPCGSQEIKCNKPCGKTRQCGLHACGRACHVGLCDVILKVDVGLGSEPPKVSCGQPCGAPRRDCPHSCVSACHPSSSQCPENRCKFMVKIACDCGRISAEVPCDAGGGTHSQPAAETKMIIGRLPTLLQPIHGTEKTPLGQRKLQCDEQCGKVENRRLLAHAFGVDFRRNDYSDTENRIFSSEMLAEMLRRDPQWVLSVEERFKTLLLGPKGTGCLKVHVFCAMPKEKRDLVYQLAERWVLSVRSIGREPWRFPIVHVTKKSKVPYLRLLSKARLPTAGQQTPPAFNSALDMEPALVVAFQDVPRDVDVNSLVHSFGAHCELVWLNDKNALAIFDNARMAATALRRVHQTSAYTGAISLPDFGRSPPEVLDRARRQNSGGRASKSLKKQALHQHPNTNWVDDECGKQRRKKVAEGAWQKKLPNPNSASKGPQDILEQSRSKLMDPGMRGCFVTKGQSTHSHAGKRQDAADDQGQMAEKITLPTSYGTERQRIEIVREASLLNAHAAVADHNENNNENWEDFLD